MLGYISVLAFAATVPLANYMISNVGSVCILDGPCLIPVAPGLMAPSGVLMIGLALVLRDLVHERLGWKWAIGAIAANKGVITARAAPIVSNPKANAGRASAFVNINSKNL